MKLTFYEHSGGTQGLASGPSATLDFEGFRILLDCGLRDGPLATTSEAKGALFPFDPRPVHSAIISNAHLKRCGGLPLLVREGFDGTIFATKAAQDVLSSVLRDYAVMARDNIEIRQQNGGEKNKALEAPFSLEEAERALYNLNGMSYHRPFHVLRNLQCSFFDAGHALGSALMVLDATMPDGGAKRLAYAADIGCVDQGMVRNPEVPNHVDVLVLTCAGGNASRAQADQRRDNLKQRISAAANRGGKILIPAFSVGPIQQFINLLDELFSSGELPEIPIYIDSPLSVNVAEIFRHHPECYENSVRSKILTETNPYGFERMKYVRDIARKRKLAPPKSPCVIISPTETCESGRIQERLLENLGNPRNLILLLDPFEKNTLAGELARGEKSVQVLGQSCMVEAEVITMKDHSGLADMNDLINYVQLICENSPKMRNVFLVGEGTEPSPALQERLKGEIGIKVLVPKPAQSVEI